MTNIPSLSTDRKNISQLDPTHCPSVNASQSKRTDKAREDALVSNPISTTPLLARHVVVPVDGEGDRQLEDCRDRYCRAIISVASLGLGVFGLTREPFGLGFSVAISLSPVWMSLGIYCGFSVCSRPIQ